MIEYIRAPAHIDGGEGLIAIVVRMPKDNRDYPTSHKAQFLTEPSNPLQMALIDYKGNDRVEAHIHHPVTRTIERTQEALFIRKGTITVTLYTSRGEHVQYVTLCRGDVILLMGGAHSIVSYDSAQVIEIKTGPYISRELDKIDIPVQY